MPFNIVEGVDESWSIADFGIAPFHIHSKRVISQEVVREGFDPFTPL